MASSIPTISATPDPGQAAPAQATSGGAFASKPDAAQATSGGAFASKPDATVPAEAIAADDAVSSTPESNSANLRLEIEDNKEAGCFVYKIINRATGEVVIQIPQEQILKLRESDSYLAGDVIKAQA